ncbi:MAG: DUF427 domain-containing protein [Acidimicrobiia bacterium]|jgi:uncharacterized protein (DUF427 family)|nr:DUF427 domain-containing protein [Acidimicrobiia bacterium]
MTSGHTVTTRPAREHVEVRLDGELIARSDHPTLLEETGLPTRYYLPKDDVTVDLRGTSFHTTCPFKGEASYWTVTHGGADHDGLAWSYETPLDGVDIAGLVCFDPARTELAVG